MPPDDYLNQCWYIVYWNKLQWNCNRNLFICIPKRHLKMSSGKRRPNCLDLNEIIGAVLIQVANYSAHKGIGVLFFSTRICMYGTFWYGKRRRIISSRAQSCWNALPCAMYVSGHEVRVKFLINKVIETTLQIRCLRMNLSYGSRESWYRSTVKYLIYDTSY